MDKKPNCCKYGNMHIKPNIDGKEWYIHTLNNKSAGFIVNFCPFCGKRLPSLVDDLLPCPFCGSHKVSVDRISGGFAARCDECGAKMERDLINYAASAWNTRSE